MRTGALGDGLVRAGAVVVVPDFRPGCVVRVLDFLPFFNSGIMNSSIANIPLPKLTSVKLPEDMAGY